MNKLYLLKITINRNDRFTYIEESITSVDDDSARVIANNYIAEYEDVINNELYCIGDTIPLTNELISTGISQTSISSQTDATIYTACQRIIYPGSDITNSPQAIKVICEITTGVTNAQIRIVDISNSDVVICELIGITNTIPAILDLVNSCLYSKDFTH